jgi:hypothetical protein
MMDVFLRVLLSANFLNTEEERESEKGYGGVRGERGESERLRSVEILYISCQI